MEGLLSTGPTPSSLYLPDGNMVLKPVTICWNEFESKVIGTFRDVLGDNIFTDVTLVTEDDQQIDSHKIILSTCSQFFRNIFERNPHQKPLLYLKDVPETETETETRKIPHSWRNPPDSWTYSRIKYN